jgi:hypothetical protein
VLSYLPGRPIAPNLGDIRFVVLLAEGLMVVVRSLRARWLEPAHSLSRYPRVGARAGAIKTSNHNRQHRALVYSSSLVFAHAASSWAVVLPLMFVARSSIKKYISQSFVASFADLLGRFVEHCSSRRRW